MDHPCTVCHGGDECVDERIPELEAKVKALEAENAHFRKALEEIKAVRYGLDPSMDETERADYWSNMAQSYRRTAGEAIRGPSPA